MFRNQVCCAFVCAAVHSTRTRACAYAPWPRRGRESKARARRARPPSIAALSMPRVSLITHSPRPSPSQYDTDVVTWSPQGRIHQVSMCAGAGAAPAHHAKDSGAPPLKKDALTLSLSSLSSLPPSLSSSTTLPDRVRHGGGQAGQRGGRPEGKRTERAETRGTRAPHPRERSLPAPRAPVSQPRPLPSLLPSPSHSPRRTSSSPPSSARPRSWPPTSAR